MEELVKALFEQGHSDYEEVVDHVVVLNEDLCACVVDWAYSPQTGSTALVLHRKKGRIFLRVVRRGDQHGMEIMGASISDGLIELELRAGHRKSHRTIRIEELTFHQAMTERYQRILRESNATTTQQPEEVR